jgi:hypothetical protein
MPEELGKIEKLPVENYRKGRKLFFVPLIFADQELPLEFTIKHNYYWEQVDSQITGLEEKLGNVKHIFHELVAEGGEEGLKNLQKINESGLQVIRKRVEAGSIFESLEDHEILAELTDWSRCLAMGLQSQKAYMAVFKSYEEVNNRRNEQIAKKIDEAIKEDESAVLIMSEGHRVHFPADIQVFYIAPPALDEIKRWLRDYETKLRESAASTAQEKTQPEQGNKPS